MNNRDLQIREKILSEIDVLKSLPNNMSLDSFCSDEKTSRAVCMTLINIGELVKSITAELREAHHEIPWLAISGMRDVTAHKYQTLRMEDVYSTCTEDIPNSEVQLKELI